MMSGAPTATSPETSPAKSALTASSARAGVRLAWSRLRPAPDREHGFPCPRSSHGLSALRFPGGSEGGASSASPPRLYLHGGEAVARTPLRDGAGEGGELSTWACEPAVGSGGGGGGGGGWRWRAVAPPSRPPPRVAHAQAAIGGVLYVHGGRAGIGMGERAMGDLWALDCTVPGNETWEEVLPREGGGGDPPPTARSFHRMVALGTDLYVFGGCGAGGRMADLHRYDTVGRTWSRLGASHLLRGRGGANLIRLDGDGGAAKGGRLAVVAGFAGEETSDGHVYDAGLGGGWKEEGMGSLLKGLRPRSVCVSGTVGGGGSGKSVALVFGGEVDPSELGHEGAGGFENDVVVLDGATGAVLQASVKGPPGSDGEDGEVWPENRGWADGDTLDDTLYVFGGLSGDDQRPRRLGDLWRCDVTF